MRNKFWREFNSNMGSTTLATLAGYSDNKEELHTALESLEIEQVRPQ